MLLKSQTIIKQEELVSILEAQLKKAKSRLTELTKADTKIKSVVAELESLLTEHPDYKLLVSDRLKLKEPEPTPMPVRIEIESIEIESVGKTAEYTESEIEAYDSLFGDGPPQTAPQTEEIITDKSAQILENLNEPIESPYSSEAEIAQLIEAHDRHDQRNQPRQEQEISAWDSGHEQVQSVVSPIQSDDEEEKIALVEKVLSELDTFEFSKTRGIPKIAMYIEIKGKSLGMIFTDKKDLVSTIELEENLIRTYALDLPLLLKDVNEGKSITLDNYCLSKKSEVGEVQQQSKPTIEQMKQQLLSKATRAELDTFKANIGETNLKEIWELCSIPERNQIKCISQAKVAKRVPATLGYKFQYTAPITKAKYEAIYLGYYLHGQPVEKDNERVIFVEGRAIICTKDDLRPCREQPGISEDERARLEAIISEEFEQPTAEEIASNTFTGLAPSPKQEILGGRAETITDAEIAAIASQMKATTGSQAGNKQEEQVLEQSVGVQTELYLKVEQPEPSKKTEVIPTPLLETVAGEIKKVNPELTFGYDSNGKSTFLDVYHGTSYIGIFEDDGVDLYSSNTSKMLHHGFTEEMIDALIEIELSPKV